MSSPTWRISRRHRSTTRRSRGQALVELALILPIFLLLIAGAIDLGRLFYAYVAIANASKEGAIFGAQNPQCDTAASCGDPRNVVWRVQNEAGNLRDAGGALPTPVVACLKGAGQVALADCDAGATYRVTVSYSFRLITPILGSLLNGGLTLSSRSEATVLNPAVDPKPGISVRKTVWNPTTKAWERTPMPDPKTGKLVPLEFSVGDTVKYRIVILNSGATPVTGLTLSDVPHGTPGCMLKLPYDCQYERVLKDSDLGGQPSRLLTDTVTVDGVEVSPVQDVAIINVLARPPELRISKNVNVYRHDSPFGNDSDLTVGVSNQVHPTVWYRIIVRNVGGRAATSLSLGDSMGRLPRNSDCPRPPDSLGPDDTYTCFYSRTFSTQSTVQNSATVDSAETPAVSTNATVRIETCSSPRLVVPNLVEQPDGDPRTVAEARSVWTGAGFTGRFTPANGSDNRDVVSQDLDPFDCRSASTDVRVTHE